MRHLLALLSFTLVLLTPSSHLRAQDVHSFIESYKSAYEKYIKEGKFNTKLMYVPTIMNLHEEKNSSWFDISLQERQQKLWNYIDNPVLENDIALDVKHKEFFIFQYDCREFVVLSDKRENLSDGYKYPSDPLMKYLQNNHADYVFTIFNLGEDFERKHWYDRQYWMITDNQLYFLRYNKDTDELYPVEAVEFINENIEFFEYSWEKP